MNTLLVFPRFKYPSGQPPLGISALYSYLRFNAPETGISIFDGTFEPHKLKGFENLIKEKKFDIIAFSVMNTMIQDVRSLTSLARRHSPGSRIVVGGPHATIEPEYFINDGLADIAVSGEGEVTLLELIKNMGDARGVKGTIYKSGSRLVREGDRGMIEDLDTLPVPDRSIFDMDSYLRAWNSLDVVDSSIRGTSVMVSRGCPYQCSFCQPTLQKIFGHRVRKNSPERVIEELTYLKEAFDIGAFMFEDDTFLMDKNWAAEICDLMIERNPGLIWCCNVRANLCDYDILKRMHRAGLRKINMGIESASQRILDDVYRKNITLYQVKEAVRIAKEIGLRVQGYFMIGHPEESINDIDETIRFARDLDIDEVSFSITTPLPGTFLFESDKGMMDVQGPNYDYYSTCVYGRGHMKVSPEKIKSRKKYAYMKFYSRPDRLAKQIANLFSKNGFKKFLYKLERV